MKAQRKTGVNYYYIDDSKASDYAPEDGNVQNHYGKNTISWKKKNFQTVSVMPFIVERAKTLHHRKKILSRHPSRTLTAQIPRSQMEPSGIIRYAHKKLQQKER